METPQRRVVGTEHKKQIPRSKKQRKAPKALVEGSHEEVLGYDIRTLRATGAPFTKTAAPPLSANSPREASDDAQAIGTSSQVVGFLPAKFTEVEIPIEAISSTGEGLGFLPQVEEHVVVVPFSLPGDRVRARLVHHHPDARYSVADLVQVVEPGTERDQELVQCRYFGSCGGCQLQMLAYGKQLDFKQTVVEKAYRHFSGLMSEVVPIVASTIASPLQYSYRTKLTPHFDGPPGALSRRRQRNGTVKFENVPPIGFQVKGMRRTIDVEDCPIATDSVRQGLRQERKRVADEIASYRKGATLLLRESTVFVKDKGITDKDSGGDDFAETTEKTCVTDSNATATEYVDKWVFQNKAGAFFQNNNSILPHFTSYIRDRIVGSHKIEYLIDAYCGSGLFTITLSSLFTTSLGIDISEPSIAAAEKNANLNSIKNATFMTADAARIFDKVTFPPQATALVIDPPRKGCDEPFLRQLLHFGPQRVVYVSCNVHTQARDVGVLVEGRDGCHYRIESLQGFDFFPQTAHVESVAILDRQ